MEEKIKKKKVDPRDKLPKHRTFKEKTAMKMEDAKKKGIKVEPVKREPTASNPLGAGRPSSIDESSAKIIAAIRNGNTFECAAGCARVSYSCFASWMRRGREDEENGILDSKFVNFKKDVEQAEKDCEQEVLGYWKREMPDNWQASKEFLARRHYQTWGSRDRVDVTSNGETLGKPVFLPLKGEE